MTTIRVSYEPNRSSIAALAVSPHLQSICHQIGEKAMGYAVATSPSGFGGYAGQFELEDEIIPDIPFRKKGEPMARVSTNLVNKSELAVLVEVGRGDPRQQEYRVLTNTLHWLTAEAAVT